MSGYLDIDWSKCPKLPRLTDCSELKLKAEVVTSVPSAKPIVHVMIYWDNGKPFDLWRVVADAHLWDGGRWIVRCFGTRDDAETILHATRCVDGFIRSQLWLRSPVFPDYSLGEHPNACAAACRESVGNESRQRDCKGGPTQECQENPLGRRAIVSGPPP